RPSDSGLTHGGTYSYYVKAIGADGLSTQSPVSSAQASFGCTNTTPDLVAMSIVPNGTLTVGSTITFTGVVKNGGGADVGAATTFQNSFTLTGPGTLPTFPAVQTTGLAVQDSKSVVSSAWTAVAGTYTIKFCADSTNVITETSGADNDASNCKDTVFTVQKDTVFTVQIEATTHTLTVTVIGNGTVTSDVGG
ncbi:MAG: CARDB domain-containing protein, partial [Patescibacteria group bacterium]